MGLDQVGDLGGWFNSAPAESELAPPVSYTMMWDTLLVTNAHWQGMLQVGFSFLEDPCD